MHKKLYLFPLLSHLMSSTYAVNPHIEEGSTEIIEEAIEENVSSCATPPKQNPTCPKDYLKPLKENIPDLAGQFSMFRDMTEKDRDDILKAKELDDNIAYNLGLFYMEFGPHENARKCWNLLVEKGHIKSMVELADLYLEEGDRKEAEKWLIKAAIKDDKSAMKRLADLYLEEGDKKEAKEWLIKAAIKDDEFAMRELADLYLEEGDKKEAKKWYKKTTHNINYLSRSPFLSLYNAEELKELIKEIAKPEEYMLALIKTATHLGSHNKFSSSLKACQLLVDSQDAWEENEKREKILEKITSLAKYVDDNTENKKEADEALKFLKYAAARGEKNSIYYLRNILFIEDKNDALIFEKYTHLFDTFVFDNFLLDASWDDVKSIIDCYIKKHPGDPARKLFFKSIIVLQQTNSNFTREQKQKNLLRSADIILEYNKKVNLIQATDRDQATFFNNAHSLGKTLYYDDNQDISLKGLKILRLLSCMGFHGAVADLLNNNVLLAKIVNLSPKLKREELEPSESQVEELLSFAAAGVKYRKEGKNDKAKKAFEKVLRIHSNLTFSTNILIYLSNLCERPQELYSFIENMSKESPQVNLQKLIIIAVEKLVEGYTIITSNHDIENKGKNYKYALNIAQEYFQHSKFTGSENDKELISILAMGGQLFFDEATTDRDKDIALKLLNFAAQKGDPNARSFWLNWLSQTALKNL